MVVELVAAVAALVEADAHVVKEDGHKYTYLLINLFLCTPRDIYLSSIFYTCTLYKPKPFI